MERKSNFWLVISLLSQLVSFNAISSQEKSVRIIRIPSSWRHMKLKLHSKKAVSRFIKVIFFKSMYEPSTLEKWSDNFITSAVTLWNFGFYTSPLLCLYMYKKEYLASDNAVGFFKMVGGVGCIMLLSFLARGVGRALNPKYVKFVEVFQSPMSEGKLEHLRKFDFEFDAFPFTYTSTSREGRASNSERKDTKAPFYKKSPMQIFALIAVRTFGLRLIYPGTIGLINSLVWNELMKGRTELVEGHNGKRNKLKTPENNSIECMLVDNRGTTTKGSILVICCEGNSGFYEIGIMSTPVAAGYSALGWNHPGFGGSTGLPYPEQEQNAIDTIMKFAINELGFAPKNIVLYGWSIGGYTAAWAAANYPEIRSLVLDATFDDLLPLAVARMPPSWNRLVTEVVRGHVDLNVSELTLQYPGDILLIRRTKDEIICLKEGELATNRANDLVLQIMQHRHPEIMGEEQLDTLRQYLSLHGHAKADMHSMLINQQDAKTKNAVLLVAKYLKDYKSTHCTPLPVDYFTVPPTSH